MKRRLKIDNSKLQKLAVGMADMAKDHPNDLIANNLARVSEKVAGYGLVWEQKLSDLDMQIIRYYMQKNA